MPLTGGVNDIPQTVPLEDDTGLDKPLGAAGVYTREAVVGVLLKVVPDGNVLEGVKLSRKSCKFRGLEYV